MPRTLTFDDPTAASGRDGVLAPLLHEPWARRLVLDHGPWRDRRVLDLATGTGVVAELLAAAVGPHGEVLASDVDASMADGSFDTVVCRHGLPFFPDRDAAVREVFRVLRPGGRVIASTWHAVEECDLFGAICGALDAMDEQAIADRLRVAFDVPPRTLAAPFERAGFVAVRVERTELDLTLDGGLAQAIELAHATTIGADLRALPGNRKVKFVALYAARLRAIAREDGTKVRVAASELTARRPGP